MNAAGAIIPGSGQARDGIARGPAILPNLCSLLIVVAAIAQQSSMGLNPDTSVADAFGFVHDAPNLGLIGGSVMGTAGARNPTQTLQALAWRTAQHLADSWDTRTA